MNNDKNARNLHKFTYFAKEEVFISCLYLRLCVLYNGNTNIIWSLNLSFHLLVNVSRDLESKVIVQIKRDFSNKQNKMTNQLF